MSTSQNGPVLETKKALEYIESIFEVSYTSKKAGLKGIPVCAWGEPGIGKTAIPFAFAKKMGWEIVNLPLGQIEEKAELQGLPLEVAIPFNSALEKEYQDLKLELAAISKEDSPEEYKELELKVEVARVEFDEALRKHRENPKNQRTVYLAPEWAPQPETHGERGILLIDDFNRADDRIVRSIMQLVQDGELVGWKLPLGWEIWLTANPDDGNYSVTSIDKAVATRFLSFEQKFDAVSWAEWAEETEIHPTCINFVLTYPEACVAGERTNPRSLERFFRTVRPFLDEPESHLTTIRTLGIMNCDAEVIGSFISYITDGFGRLPTVQDILENKIDLAAFTKKITQNDTVRIDILNSLDCRLLLRLEKEGKIEDKYLEGVRNWLKNKDLPKEIRFKSTKVAVQLTYKVGDKELSNLLFNPKRVE